MSNFNFITLQLHQCSYFNLGTILCPNANSFAIRRTIVSKNDDAGTTTRTSINNVQRVSPFIPSSIITIMNHLHLYGCHAVPYGCLIMMREHKMKNFPLFLIDTSHRIPFTLITEGSRYSNTNILLAGRAWTTTTTIM